MYLNWSTPNYYSSRLIGSYGENEGDYTCKTVNFDYLSLYDAEPFSPFMDKPIVYFKENHDRLIKFDILWLLAGQLLVSQRFKHIMEGLTSSAIEYIEPTAIYTRDKQELKEYYIINLLDNVSAIDHEKSAAVYSDDNHFLYYDRRWFKNQSNEVMLLAREAISKEIVITQDLAEQLLTLDIKVYSGFGFYTLNPLTEYKKKRK